MRSTTVFASTILCAAVAAAMGQATGSPSSPPVTQQPGEHQAAGQSGSGMQHGQTGNTQAGNTQTGQSAGQIQLPAGIATKATDDAEDIREQVAALAEAAVNKGGLSKITALLVDQDRNRLGQNSALQSDNDAVAKLDGRIDQIQKAWQAKYNDDIDIEDDNFTNLQIVQGEIQDAAAAMRGWPLPATTGRMGANAVQTGTSSDANRPANVRADGTVAPQADRTADGAVQANQGTSQQNPGIGESRDEAANLEAGREVAVVHVPAPAGMRQDITASFVGELTAWRLDIPNHITSEKLHQNLLDHLTAFGEMSNQWPADKKQAEAMLTYHVMQALYDIPVSKPSGAGTADVNEGR
jgi:hypothetical protein